MIFSLQRVNGKCNGPMRIPHKVNNLGIDPSQASNNTSLFHSIYSCRTAFKRPKDRLFKGKTRFLLILNPSCMLVIIHPDSSNRTISVFRDNDFKGMVLDFLVIIRFPVQEQNDIGILFHTARFPNIRHHRPFIGS